jgi:hypothetical protein
MNFCPSTFKRIFQKSPKLIKAAAGKIFGVFKFSFAFSEVFHAK